MTSPITLPIATVQPTIQTVIDDVRSGLVSSEDIWISCYKLGLTSVHGKVKVSLSETDRSRVDLEARDGVDIKALGRSSYSVACPALSIPHTRVALPRQTFSDPERSNPRLPQQISAFDISPDGTQIATGYNNGSIFLSPVTSVSRSPANTNVVELSYKAHLTTVTSLRFFPSSRVLLSAGGDFKLSIFPAEALPGVDTGSTNSESLPFKPVRHLSGHTRSITGTAMISRGRNVLSAAKDGTVRLWDVSGGQQIRAMWSTRYVPINDISIGDKADFKVGTSTDPDPDGDDSVESNDGSGTAIMPLPLDPREVDTAGNLAYCALQDGEFEVFDLATKNSVFHSSSNAANGLGTTAKKSYALTAISYSLSSNLLATGSANGVITVYDTRNLSSPLTSFTRNGSSIESLVFVVPSSLKFLQAHSSEEGELGLAIATEDGLPYVAEVRPEGPGVVAELVGGDCEAVRVIRVRGEDGAEIWTAGDDGVVRKY